LALQDAWKQYQEILLSLVSMENVFLPLQNGQSILF